MGLNPPIDIFLRKPEIARDITKELFNVSIVQIFHYINIFNELGDEKGRNEYENI